jgi:hypothetical protein
VTWPAPAGTRVTWAQGYCGRVKSSHPARGAAASVASAAFEAVARARQRKPVHPRGLVVPAHLVRHGLTGSVGAAWVDEPGSGEGIARISRSAGFPDGWPDVWGLALRFDAPQTASGVTDLMLATSFPGRATRHALALRRGLQAPLTCVLPYRTGSGRTVMIGVPERSAQLPGRREPLAAHLARHRLRLTVAVAEAGSTWRPFATLTLGGAVLGTGDGHDDEMHDDEMHDDGQDARADVSFEPVLNPLPGMVLPEPLATIRSRAYAGARAGRDADAATLHRLPTRH